MFDWLKRKCPLRGIVFFRAGIPPTPDSFARLAQAGIDIREAPTEADERWRLTLSHTVWGRAELSCSRNFEPIPDSLVDWSWLTDAEKAEARLGESAVFVEMDAAGENILRERKQLLRFLAAVSGDDGVAVFDVMAHKLWSRDDLEDELSHDADLDIMDLFTVHAVTGETDEDLCWVHTHGLADIGLTDFHLVQPGPGREFVWRADGLRTIAGAIMEGDAEPGGGPFLVGYPDGLAQLAPMDKFLRDATGYPGDLMRELVGNGDPDYGENHRRGHVVVCDAASSGLIGRLFSGNRLRPLRYLWNNDMEDGMVCVSSAMTRLMAARARNTYGALLAISREFAEFDFPILVKLGYETDHGDDGELEHLWFGVNELDEDRIDATLLNEPFDIESMEEGERGNHSIDRLTHWMMQTPMGNIDPQSFTAARMVRADPEAIRAMIREMKEA